MAKRKPSAPKRVRMVNEYGVPAHPLTEQVPLWEKQGWKLEPEPESDSAPETDPEPADAGDNPQ